MSRICSIKANVSEACARKTFTLRLSYKVNKTQKGNICIDIPFFLKGSCKVT